MPQIHHVARPVQAAIATVDHQIRVGGTGLTDHGVPVGPLPRRGPRQVSAGTRITRAAATPQSLPARSAAGRYWYQSMPATSGRARHPAGKIARRRPATAAAMLASRPGGTGRPPGGSATCPVPGLESPGRAAGRPPAHHRQRQARAAATQNPPPVQPLSVTGGEKLPRSRSPCRIRAPGIYGVAVRCPRADVPIRCRFQSPRPPPATPPPIPATVWPGSPGGRARTWPGTASSALTAAGVCEALCGSTPVITTATVCVQLPGETISGPVASANA
jgi:hypothetical protein